MKKSIVLMFAAFSFLGVGVPPVHAAACEAGYTQTDSGDYFDVNGSPCTPDASSGEVTAARDTLPPTDPGTPKTNPVSQTSVGGVQSNAANQGNAAKSSGFVALAPIPGLTDADALSAARSTNLASFFNNLYKFLIGIAAALAVIMIIWGGLEYSTQDSISKKSDGKQRIYQAIFGLILVLSPVLVFSIINPSILNLSINLKPLDTKSPSTVQTGQRTLPTCSSIIRTNCVPGAAAAFNEGYYFTPPVGSYCFKFDLSTIEGARAAGGENLTATPNPYYCAKNQTGVAQSCRVALVSFCPTSANVSGDGTTITGSCPGLATTCAPY